jgi:3-mercaptopyruvate sulfurtransferase SseA
MVGILLIALILPLFLFGTVVSAEEQAPVKKNANRLHVPSVKEDTPPQSTEPQAPFLTPLQVKERIDKGGLVMMIDVRSAQEFNAMHIAGSVSVPLAQIGSLVNALPREADIVFY